MLCVILIRDDTIVAGGCPSLAAEDWATLEIRLAANDGETGFA
jgi:hypothetical protein